MGCTSFLNQMSPNLELSTFSLVPHHCQRQAHSPRPLHLGPDMTTSLSQNSALLIPSCLSFLHHSSSLCLFSLLALGCWRRRARGSDLHCTAPGNRQILSKPPFPHASTVHLPQREGSPWSWARDQEPRKRCERQHWARAVRTLF